MAFTGTYDFVSSNNFDEYLKAVGIGMVKRMVISAMKPKIEILTGNDGTYTIKTISTFKNMEISFKPGVEFDEELADGRMAKSTVTVDGNKLMHIQRIGNEQGKIIREFNGDEMKATFIYKDISSVRMFKKTS